MERPLLILLAALASGIVAAALPGWFVPPWLLPLTAACCLASLVARRQALLVASLAILCLVWGNLALQPLIKPVFPQNHLARLHLPEPVVLTAVVDRRPEIGERGSRLYLEAESVREGGRSLPVTGRLLLYVGDGRTTVSTGDRIRVRTRLRQPRPFGIPGEYDLQRRLALQGVYLTGFVATAGEVQLLQPGAAHPFQRRIDLLAGRLGDFIQRSVAPPDAGVLRALLIGDRGAAGRQVEELYARTGVNHILSISGFHVGIIALFLHQLLWLVARRSETLLLFANLRRILLLMTVPVLVFYLLLSGAAPATTRSVLMIGACCVGLLAERALDPLNLLALAALAILAVTPQALFDLSFQLSFLALWGILLFTPLLMRPFSWMRKGVAYRSLQFCMVSVAAIAATMVPVAYHFHRVTLIGVASNIVVVPLVGYGAVLLGFTALAAVAWFPSLASLLLQLAAMLVHWSGVALLWLDRLPGLPPLTPTPLELATAVAVMVAFTVFRRKGPRLLATALAAVILVSARSGGDEGDGRLRITFFSVGQGESTLIRFPDRTTMLVDGGGSLREGGMDVGERLLAPALWTLGVKRIDYLVLSHPHPDHLRGLRFVAANFPVGEFWESGLPHEMPDYRELRQILAARGVPVRTIRAGTTPFRVGGALVEPLAPLGSSRNAAPAAPLVGEINDESLVFRLSLDRFAILFTGDSGFVTEARLLRRPELLACTVLKVAHHGSRYSSSIPFIKAAHPRFALISAGYNNSFHLPSAVTLADLQKLGADVYRTDLDGTIELDMDRQSGRMTVRKLTRMIDSP